MSVHKSLVVRSALTRARNVFTRAERLEKLAETGKWKEGESIFGLPKVKTRGKVRKVKKEKKPEEGAPAEGAAPAAAPGDKGAAAPAAAGKAAAPAGKAAAPAKGAKK
jgi:small basic protein (TIGR04137 family)